MEISDPKLSYKWSVLECGSCKRLHSNLRISSRSVDLQLTFVNITEPEFIVKLTRSINLEQRLIPAKRHNVDGSKMLVEQHNSKMVWPKPRIERSNMQIQHNIEEEKWKSVYDVEKELFEYGAYIVEKEQW